MKRIFLGLAACALAILPTTAPAQQGGIECGQIHTVARGDTLSGISLRAYGSPLYQPIYTANVDTIGTNPDKIQVGYRLTIPCLGAAATERDAAPVEGQLTFTFNKASAPPFIINSGIIDKYLAEITEVTEGRVTFVDPEVVNRDHSVQLDLVTSGQVDGAYALNVHLAESHPLLQLPMEPMFGGSAEQTAVSLWRLHDQYLAKTDYFTEAKLLGFVSAPAAHIWRDSKMQVSAAEGIAEKNQYAVPYFSGLDTRGPAAMRAEVAAWAANYASQNTEPPTYFLAHGAAIALGIWDETSSIEVMEVDNGLYTPTFSVVLSNAAWAQISPRDQQAILQVSGEALANRSAEWDAFDNSFRSRMLDLGLVFKKADKALLNDLFQSSLGDLKTWTKSAAAAGIPATEALKFYLSSLHSLKDRLIYRAPEQDVGQHPFVTGAL